MNQMFPESSALEVVDVDEDGATVDPYDSYRPTNDQKEIAVRDVKIGTGVGVGEEDGQTVEMTFSSNLLADGKISRMREFDVNSMVVKMGEERCLPGLEEGIQGMKVGGIRKVKVPPNKGYGDNWYRGIVPPSSHLDFEVELLTIAESPIEELKMKIQKFGVGRAIGMTVCVGFLAISPILQQKGILL